MWTEEERGILIGFFFFSFLTLWTVKSTQPQKYAENFEAPVRLVNVTVVGNISSEEKTFWTFNYFFHTGLGLTKMMIKRV